WVPRLSALWDRRSRTNGPRNVTIPPSWSSSSSPSPIESPGEPVESMSPSSVSRVSKSPSSKWKRTSRTTRSAFVNVTGIDSAAAEYALWKVSPEARRADEAAPAPIALTVSGTCFGPETLSLPQPARARIVRAPAMAERLFHEKGECKSLRSMALASFLDVVARPDVVGIFYIIAHLGAQAVAHRSTMCDTGVTSGRARLGRNAPVPRFRRTNASSPSPLDPEPS